MGLIGLTGPAGQAHATQLIVDAKVRLPKGLDLVMQEYVLAELPPVLKALMTTTDMPTSGDFRPLYQAAAHLGVVQFLAMGPTGPTLDIPSIVSKWREYDAARLLLEVYMLCGVPDAVLQEDLQLVYGSAVSLDDLEVFRQLFMDTTYVVSTGWAEYERTIDAQEARFKRQLIGQPHDYVRWRMGVPVALDSERVLTRLISDAYYTERTLKGESGGMGVRLTKDDLARVKLERDTIFKSMAMKLKLKDAGATTSDDSAEIARVIGELKLEFTSNEAMPTVDDILST